MPSNFLLADSRDVPARFAKMEQNLSEREDSSMRPS